MFDMKKIGKKIRGARTEKNMTQMDLADAMGISYQAVSNWERGNSMPDISKLPELCQILDMNVDELIGNGDTVNTVRKMISDENASISLEELADVVPIVTPKKMEQVIDDNIENDESIDAENLVGLAPFLDDNMLGELAKRVSLEDIYQLISLAPFLEEEQLHEIILNYKGSFDECVEAVISLAPFLSEDTLDYLTDKCLAVKDLNISMLVGLCPFLSSETIHKISEYAMAHKRYDVLAQVAPFM